MKTIYILVINIEFNINSDQFNKKLNNALDWVQIMPNVFLIESTSDKTKWVSRLKPVLGNNKFFLTEININNNTGWIPKFAWEWIRTKR